MPFKTLEKIYQYLTMLIMWHILDKITVLYNADEVFISMPDIKSRVSDAVKINMGFVNGMNFIAYKRVQYEF